MKHIIASITIISSLIFIFLSVAMEPKAKKLVEKLRPFVKEEEKKILDAVWWKTGTLDRDYFLVKAQKRFKDKIPSLVQFRNLFWARSFFMLLTLVMVYANLLVKG